VPPTGAVVIVAVSASPSGSLSLASTLIVPVWSSTIARLSSAAFGAWLTATVTAVDWTWNASLEPAARAATTNCQVPACGGV
jgi:hypothetical protein